MNKTEYVAAVAEASGMTKTQAALAVDACIAVVTNALKKVKLFKLLVLVRLKQQNVLLAQVVTLLQVKKLKSLLLKHLSLKQVKF